MSLLQEKRLSRIDQELDLQDGPMSLSPKTIRESAGLLYVRLNEMIHPSPANFQKFRPVMNIELFIEVAE